MNPINGIFSPCIKCFCNNHDAPGTTCDPATGACLCINNTKGIQCDQCMDGYYGYPTSGRAGAKSIHIYICVYIFLRVIFSKPSVLNSFPRDLWHKVSGDKKMWLYNNILCCFLCLVACQPCMCPGNVPLGAVNALAATCHNDGQGGFICDNCTGGASGNRCDVCSFGYFGTPNDTLVCIFIRKFVSCHLEMLRQWSYLALCD